MTRRPASRMRPRACQVVVLAAAALALAAAAAWSASPAGAQTAAPTTTSTTVDCSVNNTCSNTPPSGDNNGLLPSDGSGNPISDDHLDIGWSTGGGLFATETNPVRQAIGSLTDLFFQGDRLVSHFALSQIYDALQFKYVTDGPLPTTAEDLANAYQTQLVGPLGIAALCIFLGIAWGAWKMIKGEVSRGLGEIAITALILLLVGAAFAQPATLLLGPNGLAAQSREAAITVGGIVATGQAPPDPNNPSADIYTPLLTGMSRTFIFVPYELLDWGQVLDDPTNPTACAKTLQNIEAHGPWGASDTPRNEMLAVGDPTCTAAKNFNYTPTTYRLITAIFAFFGSFGVLLFAVVIAFGLILAQLAMLVAVVVAPFVFALAAIPGAGRLWLYRWVGTVISAFLAQIVAVFVLSLLMVGMNAIAGEVGTDSQPLLYALALMNLLVVAAIFWWFKYRKSSKRAAARVTSQLAAMRIGGGNANAWAAPLSLRAHGEGAEDAAKGVARGVARRASVAAISLVAGAGAGALAGQITRRARRKGSDGGKGSTAGRPRGRRYQGGGGPSGPGGGSGPGPSGRRPGGSGPRGRGPGTAGNSSRSGTARGRVPTVSVDSRARLRWAGTKGWGAARRAEWVDRELSRWGTTPSGSLEERARALADLTAAPSDDDIDAGYQRWVEGGGPAEERRARRDQQIYNQTVRPQWRRPQRNAAHRPQGQTQPPVNAGASRPSRPTGGDEEQF